MKDLIAYTKKDHYYRIVAIDRVTGEDKIIDFITESIRFCNILAEFNEAHPGWAIEESWEIEIDSPHRAAIKDCF